jgi:hypothetical protein
MLPRTLTEIDPEEGKTAGAPMEIVTASNEKILTLLTDANFPRENISDTSVPKPIGDFSDREESAVQTKLCPMVIPTREVAVYEELPKHAPVTKTIELPVDGWFARLVTCTAARKYEKLTVQRGAEF